MKKFAFLGLFLGAFVSFLLAVERPKFEDFAACYERNKASILTYEGMQAFALSENLLAVIKKPETKLNKYVKYDPYLNLYLVRTEFSLIPTKMIDEQNLTRNDWVGILDPNTPYIGHIKYLANNIDERDRLDFTSKTGMLSTPCCNMIGIALENGDFIGNRYLKHFMKYNDAYWGDIGVDFDVREDKIYVKNVRKAGQFLVNDELISIDGTPVSDLRKVNEKILFADRGATLYFGVLRDNVDMNLTAVIYEKDLSKFKLPDTKPKPVNTDYTSNLGLVVNKYLGVKSVSGGSKAALAGFKTGDLILRVNNEIIRDLKQLQSIMNREAELNFLVQRKSKNLPINNFNNSLDLQNSGDGNFQFFIRLVK